MKFSLPTFPKIRTYTLSYRLFGYVVLISSLFALLATATQLYLDYRRDVAAIYNSFSFIKKPICMPSQRAHLKLIRNTCSLSSKAP